MLILNIVVNMVIKVVVWLIKANMNGEQIPEKKLAKVNELLWLCEKLQPEAVRAGCAVGGTQPTEWDYMFSCGDDE